MTTKTALTNVRVFDGNQLTEPRTVVIDDTLIGTDPTGAQEIDGAGAVLLPGLIDAHVHLHAPEALDALAEWGVTTGLDMACFPHERVLALREHAGSADFRTAGLPAIGPDGFRESGLDDVPAMPAQAVIRTAEDARRFVAARVVEGVAYVKGMVEAPGEGGPSLEALRALVAEAHPHNLKTVFHTATVGAYTLSAQAGTDFITHIPADGPVRPEDVALIRANGQVVVPTITLMARGAERLSGGRMTGPDVVENVVALQQAGVVILAGTDATVMPGVPFNLPLGESMHDEMDQLASIGMRPVDILRSATLRTAHAFGLFDRGAILPACRSRPRRRRPDHRHHRHPQDPRGLVCRAADDVGDVTPREVQRKDKPTLRLLITGSGSESLTSTALSSVAVTAGGGGTGRRVPPADSRYHHARSRPLHLTQRAWGQCHRRFDKHGIEHARGHQREGDANSPGAGHRPGPDRYRTQDGHDAAERRHRQPAARPEFRHFAKVAAEM